MSSTGVRPGAIWKTCGSVSAVTIRVAVVSPARVCGFRLVATAGTATVTFRSGWCDEALPPVA